jgi:hypothetical protein
MVCLQKKYIFGVRRMQALAVFPGVLRVLFKEKKGWLTGIEPATPGSTVQRSAD